MGVRRCCVSWRGSEARNSLLAAAGFSHRERPTCVPETPQNVVILSTRPLVRELLAELIRIRCEARIVSKLESLEHSLVPIRTASVMVCDPHGLEAAELDSFISRLTAGNPRLRIVRIDDSQAAFSAEDVVTAVRGPLAPAPLAHEKLTALELEVMLAIAAGHRNADIARRMRRSCKTVEKHRANLLRKLGVRTVAQLTAFAIHHGLLRADAILAPPNQR